MSTLRRLRACAAVLLALFVATGTLPHAGVYSHQHGGGERAHVHPWGVGAGEDEAYQRLVAELDREYHRRHPHEHGPGVRAPDGALHAHWQSPYPQSTAPEAPLVVHATLVHRLAPRHRLPPGVEPCLPAVARGPPPARAL
jgi:hypothetical protein